MYMTTVAVEEKKTQTSSPSFVTNVTELAAKVPLILRAIDRRDPREVYATMTVHVRETGDVVLHGANALWKIEAKIPAEKVHKFKSGTVLVSNPHNLSGLLAKFPNEQVSFYVEGNFVHVKSERAIGRFPLLNEKPIDNTVVGEERLFLRSKVRQLTDFLKSVSYAAARGDATGYSMLNTLKLEVGDKFAVAVATDSNRLAFATNEVEATEEQSAMLPIETIDGILGVLARIDDESEVSVQLIGERAACFTCGDIVITTRLTEGMYPNWRKVIPNENAAELKVTVDRAQMLEVLARVGIASDGAATVNLKPEKEGLLVSLVGVSGKNQYEEVIEAQIVGFKEGKNYQNLFNYQLKFLTDCVTADQSNEVTLHFNSGNAPLLVTGDGLVKALVMPIRVQ